VVVVAAVVGGNVVGAMAVTLRLLWPQAATTEASVTTPTAARNVVFVRPRLITCFVKDTHRVE
jgi:hypothetical protein